VPKQLFGAGHSQVARTGGLVARANRFRDNGGTHSIVRMTGNITKGGCDNPDCTCENCNCGSGCTCGKD